MHADEAQAASPAYSPAAASPAALMTAAATDGGGKSASSPAVLGLLHARLSGIPAQLKQKMDALLTQPSDSHSGAALAEESYGSLTVTNDEIRSGLFIEDEEQKNLYHELAAHAESERVRAVSAGEEASQSATFIFIVTPSGKSEWRSLLGKEKLSLEEFKKIRLFRHLRLLHYPVHPTPWFDRKGEKECETMRNLNSNNTLFMETTAQVLGGAVGLIHLDAVPIVAPPRLSEVPNKEWEDSKPAWGTAMSASFAFTYTIAKSNGLVIMVGSQHMMQELLASEPFSGLVVGGMEKKFPQLAGIIPDGVPVTADVYHEHATGLTVTVQDHPCNPTPVTERLALVVFELCVAIRDLPESTQSKLTKQTVRDSFLLADSVHGTERDDPGAFATFAAVARDNRSTAKEQLTIQGFCPSQCEVIISLVLTRSGKLAILENHQGPVFT